MMNRMFCGLAGILIVAYVSARGEESHLSAKDNEDAAVSEKPTVLTVLYNNIAGDERCTAAWGMSCLVEGGAKTVLFDTGGNGRILLRNMEVLGKDPGDVDIVVLSHIHADHTGGLADFLARNSDVQVFVPDAFPDSLKADIRETGAELVAVRGPQKITRRIHTTGQIGMMLKEQALILETAKGIVLITGCSHPGVENLAKRAAKVCPDQPFRLITGGFHLGGASRKQVDRIIELFRSLEVRKVGPSHCTGAAATAMFREAWGDNFLNCGCGAVIKLNSKQ
ncbi:MAG: MBL fold metallo-hydrolase [Candidatus Pacebacteria bacterium]|nr:MBL fold metallo-hydrolase [Candidatus Paceibacterota bacterium]